MSELFTGLRFGSQGAAASVLAATTGSILIDATNQSRYVGNVLPLGGAHTVTIAPNAGLGQVVLIGPTSGAGTLTPGSGVTFNGASSSVSIPAYARAVVSALSSNAYDVAIIPAAATAASLQALVSGAGVIATSRAAVATDNAGTFGLRTGATYTISDPTLIPAGVILIAGASGGGTIAVGGSVTINGGTSSVTLTARQMATVYPTDGSTTDLTVKVA